MAFQEIWSVRHGWPPLLDVRSWGGALGVFGIAFLVGLAVLPRLRAWRFGDRFLLRLLAGLIVTPPLFLGIGQIPGALGAIPWLAPAAAGWVVFLYILVKGRLRPESQPQSLYEPAAAPLSPLARWLTRLGWLGAVLSLLVRLVPAFCPPLGYDTLEYHMGIIPHVFQLGLYRPIPHIFYTAQPQSTEALYTLAAFIEGTPWGFAPGALHWLFVVLAAVLVARIFRLLCLRACWRPWLLLFFLEHPLLWRLQSERMSDWFGVLLMAGGLWVTLQGRRDAPHSGALRLAALLGLFVGGAAGSKWTHIGTVALPLLILAFFLGWEAWRVEGVPRWMRLRSALGALGLAGVVGFAVWLPWGVWLWALRRNPFAPFMAGRFPSPEWPPARLHFLIEAHGPLNPLHSDYWLNLLERLTVRSSGPPLIAMALLATLLLIAFHAAWRRAGTPDVVPRPLRVFAVRLAAGVLGGVLLWGNLAQAADRFLAPLCLASLVVFALVLHALVEGLRLRYAERPARLLSPLVAFLFGVLAVLNARYTLLTYYHDGMLQAMTAHACGTLDRYGYIRSFYGEEVRVIRAANSLPATSRILALDDARRYLYTGRIDTASVFDASPIRPAVTGAASGEEIRVRLRAQGYTHVLYHGYEMVRILRMQTPPALRRDSQFQAVLRLPFQTPEARAHANEILARVYWGLTEFSVDPLTASERAAYGEFLAAMQPKAIAMVPHGEPGAAPSFWLAEL